MVARPMVGGERSTREVLVTLLLVVFVIVVTAFVATVVLDMGQDSTDDDMAKVSVEFDAENDAIRVAFTSMTRPGTTVDVTITNTSSDRTAASTTFTSVGQRQTFGELDDGARYRLVAVAEWRNLRAISAIRTDRL